MWDHGTRLTELPSSERTLTVARDLGRRVLDALSGSSVHELADALGWRLAFREFPDHDMRSLLVPMRTGDFSVLINDRVAPGSPEAVWLLCHEIGHSLFWCPGEPPRRIVRTLPGEESFADNFANILFEIVTNAEKQAA